MPKLHEGHIYMCNIASWCAVTIIFIVNSFCVQVEEKSEYVTQNQILVTLSIYYIKVTRMQCTMSSREELMDHKHAQI